MLMACGIKKLLLCAPSNAALDEVVQRITQKKLLGVSNFVTSDLVRVGAIEYEPLPCVKVHTLDDLVDKMLLGKEELKST